MCIIEKFHCKAGLNDLTKNKCPFCRKIFVKTTCYVQGGLVHLWVQAKHFNWKEIDQRLEEHTAEFFLVRCVSMCFILFKVFIFPSGFKFVASDLLHF